MVNFGYYVKPSFLIVGAQKAGTTALFQLLAHHSGIKAPKTKEISYFYDDSLYNLRGHYYYHIHFPKPHQIGISQQTFEATPEYLYHPKCAERIYTYRPDIKIIILLREPVSRAYSAWTMYHNFYKSKNHNHLEDSRSFENAINNELNNIDSVNWYMDKFGYLRRGIYHDQVKRYLKIFPKDQLLILESEELKTDSNNGLPKVLDFLSLSKEIKLHTNKTNKREYSNEIDPKTMETLIDFYKPYNTELFDLLNKDYGWNNIL